MDKFLRKYWAHAFGLALLALAGFAITTSPAKALQTNPTISQTDATRNNEYAVVYNGEAVDFTDGMVLVWAPATATNYGIAVTTISTAASPRAAGVAKGTIRAGKFGRMQVYGYHSAVRVNENVSAGDVLVTSTAATRGMTLTIALSTATVFSDYGAFAHTLEAGTGGSTVKAFIRRE